MGGGAPSTTTQIQKVQLPKWVEEASQSNYNFAKDIAAKPLVQYGGQTVSDVAPQTQQAWDMIANSGDVGATNYAGAQYGYTNALGGSAPTVTAGMLKDTDLNPYMNPFQDEVINRTLSDLGTQNTQQLGVNADKAAAAGAFGGSRGAIVDALTNASFQKQGADTSAKLRADNFSQAQAAATGDLNRGFQGALSNQSAYMQDQGNKLAASQGLASLGDSETKNMLSKYMSLSDAGNAQKSQQQSVLDAAKGKFDEANDYDLTQLNILLSSLGMSPYGKTSTTTNTQSGGGGTDFAQAGMGLLSIFGGLFGASDRELKTDITKLGKDELTGLDMYAYRYKGDPKSYPKVVGPMAQDIEKIAPKAIRKIGKRRVVDRRIIDIIPGAGRGILSRA